MYKKLGEKRPTGKDTAIQELEEQIIKDRFGDVPM
jgi:hypothetical protein